MRSLASLALLTAALAACSGGPGPGPACDSTCAGCCSAGVCTTPSPQACGSLGNACIACAAGDVCRAGLCVAVTSCTPATCASAGTNCGTMPDGCGGTLSCGSCSVAGESCGGAGTANVCGAGTCTPRTCESQGLQCGVASDGCSTTLECGACTAAGETCGGGGTPNLCGKGACTPVTCAEQGKNCGTAPDGCGNLAPCGDCSVAGETCGGGGTPGVCGKGACTPTTCAQLGKNCGSVSDGCGNMLACGSCSGLQTCGGAGTQNVCGATCVMSCPTGFTCNDMGVCAGGSVTTLALNVRTFNVSGTVTQNGMVPTGGTCTSSPRGYVNLVDAAQGYSFSFPIPCMGSPATFGGAVYPGTYRVTVAGNSANGSSLPAQAQTVQQSLTVSADVTGLAYDVRTFDVSGTVTQNGMVPTGGTCTSSPRGYVTLTDAAQGYRFTFDIPCMGSPATFSG
ncbi:MAG: hypothetical protein JNK82_05395, partial [Myxococcaceae bacterium]|nr:hypothetical protein [Myxococcaceae bacterium]